MVEIGVYVRAEGMIPKLTNQANLLFYLHRWGEVLSRSSTQVILLLDWGLYFGRDPRSNPFAL